MDSTEPPASLAETVREILGGIEERHERIRARLAYSAGERAARLALIDEQRIAREREQESAPRPLSDDPELRIATAVLCAKLELRLERLAEARRGLKDL